MKKEIIDAIEKVIGYEFSNEALLIQAFTRESYAKEQRVKGLDCEGNEQLEFFGDTVLGYLVVSGAFDNFTNNNFNVFYVGATPSGSGGGKVTFYPQVARFQRGHPRLLLRVSPPETRTKTSPINKSHSVSYDYYFVHRLRRQERRITSLSISFLRPP